MGKILFDDASDDLLNDYRINGKASLESVERRVDVLKPTFKTRRLISITTSDVRVYIAERQTAGAANATINPELAALKRMFTLAIQAGKLRDKPYSRCAPFSRYGNGRPQNRVGVPPLCSRRRGSSPAKPR